MERERRRQFVIPLTLLARRLAILCVRHRADLRQCTSSPVDSVRLNVHFLSVAPFKEFLSQWSSVRVETSGQVGIFENAW